jgi:hypothetical protein
MHKLAQLVQQEWKVPALASVLVALEARLVPLAAPLKAGQAAKCLA